ncbi:FAD-binding oxidoreductase [Actinospica sp. MGRD01-02]|uniref:FAD-binding oxidoreductase n=1 Tax=Actinospica acidithermotolerans TaxID=2828514 RepID=A0A941IKB8_9ACTN|nr:FAD-binding protein [Actinospica acidithermotolerans]MBR7826571.1 FAD-binding oxidoreductase [Actinospica acidithermotolerans]
MAQSLGFDGRLVLPGDADWEDARVGRVFNGRRPDRQPDAVLIAGSVEDVQRGVRLANEKGWTVAVRSGGHSWAAWSVREGGLLIDLGALREMSYDEETRVVTANPAVKGGDELSPFLEQRGRFFNGGHCPSVGLGGFLLQGGQGWNQRGWGWAAESVVAVDVVTADGELVRADETQNSDLYWAARGSGPAFPGVVVRFHLATRPLFGFLGHTVHGYELEDFAEVMAWLYEAHHRISTDVEIVAVSTPIPLPDGTEKRAFLITGLAMVDDEETARAALAPFNECPAIDRAIFVQDCAASTLAEQRGQQTLQNPEHWQYITDNAWIDCDNTPDGIARTVEHLRPLFTTNPTDKGFAIWMSNAPMRDLPDMAFSLQTEAYVASYTVYEDAAEFPRNREWLTEAMAYAQPVTAGQYLGDSDMTHRQLRFMAPENWARLREIIAARDPQGRFHRYLAKDHDSLNVNHWLAEVADVAAA